VELQAGTVVDGRYEIRGLLARGGMATVYEATDLRLERTVALKIMHRHLAEDPDFVSRFEREAKSAARLSHPHVVAVYDQGRADGSDGSDGMVYLAMEFVPGRTLRDVLRDFGPLSPEQALVLLEPVLEALEAAHAAGFVHRDIKPENVLIADDGRVKVADFGLARAMATSNTSATQGMIIGTVAYLSPEQVERGEADARSDVYAAGILLFEMITGGVPHAGETPLSVAYQHVHHDVPAPSSVRAGVPPAVDALVLTATRRDPAGRYPRAADFLAEARRVRTALPRPRPFTAVSDDGAVNATLIVPVDDSLRRMAEQSGYENDDVEPRRRRKAPWVIGFLVLAVAAAAFGGWFLAGALGPKVPVPAVVGQTQAQATGTLAAAGLTLVVDGAEFSETAAKDTVISSDPATGAEVKQDGEVGVVLSRGPERYAVPDVTGMSVEQATSAITEAKLVPAGTVEAFDDTVPVGQVAGTDPVIGNALKPGTSVSILISKGPQPVPVPDITGIKVGAATKQLAAAGLQVDLKEKYSEKVPLGVVISVTPEAGTIVSSGTAVEMLVSKGPPPVTVPRLIDMRKKDAVALLRRLGLVPKIVKAELTPLNRVYTQDPPAGTELPKGSVVTIRIV